jgi:hypothetical protein
VQNRAIKFRVFVVAVSLLLANSVYAMDMGNMMNPSKWMGGNSNRDRYDDDYDRRGYDRAPGYGYGGAPGYGGGAPGYGYGGAPGYGGGSPGYGYGGAPAYEAPKTESNEAEIMRLKERIRQLEGGAR